jgi:hypothetical protein
MLSARACFYVLSEVILRCAAFHRGQTIKYTEDPSVRREGEASLSCKRMVGSNCGHIRSYGTSGWRCACAEQESDYHDEIAQYGTAHSGGNVEDAQARKVQISQSH